MKNIHPDISSIGKFDAYISALGQLAGVHVARHESRIAVNLDVPEASEHNIDFDARTGRWEEGVFPGEHTWDAEIGWDGYVHLVGEDQFRFSLHLESGYEAADIVEFYRQARRTVAAEVEWREVPLSTLIPFAALPVSIDDSWRLLPLLSSEVIAKLPDDLGHTISAHLTGKWPEAGKHRQHIWTEIPEVWSRELSAVCSEVLSGAGFSRTHYSLETFIGDCRALGGDVWSYLKPNRAIVSDLFFREFFGYSAEGTVALAAALDQPLEEIPGKFTSTSVSIPATKQQQTRLALEARLTREACRNEVEKQLQQKTPMREMGARLRTSLNLLSGLGAPAL